MMMKPMICFLLLAAVWTVQDARAQGWERLYAPGNAADFTQTPDGGFLLAGEYGQWDADGKAWLLKTDADGDVEWTRRYTVGDTLEAYTAVQLLDNQHFVAAGYFLQYWSPSTPEHLGGFLHKLDAGGNLLAEVLIDPTPGQNTDYVVKDLQLTPAGNILAAVSAGTAQTVLYAFDPGLQQLWQSLIPARINQLAVMPDGSILLCGAQNNTMYLRRTNASGALIWEKTYDPGEAWMTLTQDGNIALARSVRLLKVDTGGNLLWSKAGPSNGNPNWITEDAGGNLLAIGYYNANFTYAFSLEKYNAGGSLVWKKTPHQSLAGVYSTARPLVTADGGIALAGQRDGQSMLIRSDAAFDLYRSWIAGSMFHDLNDDCTKDADEKPLKYFYATATDQHGSTWTTYLPTGQFAMQVPAGDYTVTISKRSFDPENWLPCPGQTVTVAASTDTAHVTPVGVRSVADCPRPHIQAAIPKVRSCHEGRYNLKFYNLGTQKATNVQIEVELADNLTYVGSSLPLLSQNGQQLVFDAGDLDIDDEGGATLDVFCSCDAAIGDLACSSFRILPDSCYPVLPDWDHSIIKMDAAYDPGQVSFTLENAGTGDMAQPRWFRLRNTCLNIVEQGTFQLTAGETLNLSYPNQAIVYYFEAEPVPNQPYIPGSAVLLSNCQPGQLKESWMNNATGSPFYDIECSTVTNSFDPNDISVSPRGDGTEGAILATESELRYMIRFQNTGTDTAYTVSIRDTLPAELEILSVAPGPSSHAYTFDLRNRVLQFHFAQINLPQRAVNAEASQGYVVFTVRLKPNLPAGTRIENRAAIYFDFNQPVITNTALNTIRDAAVVSVENPLKNGLEVITAPNPTSDRTVFQFKKPVQGVFALFDTGGRQLQQVTLNGGQFELDCQHLPAGIYFFRIQATGEQPVQGKLVKN